MLPRTKVSPFSPEDVLSPTSAALAAPESPWQPARDDDLAWITEAVNADAEKEEDASTADSDDKIVGPHGEHVIIAKLARFPRFCKLLQTSGGLVLGCIKTKFCKKIYV